MGDEELSVIDHRVKYDDDTTGITRGVPRVGEDTYEMLERMGYTGAEVAALVERGVVGSPGCLYLEPE